jgi:hypothetical protein
MSDLNDSLIGGCEGNSTSGELAITFKKSGIPPLFSGMNGGL